WSGIECIVAGGWWLVVEPRDYGFGIFCLGFGLLTDEEEEEEEEEEREEVEEDEVKMR
ncbi:MAG: hypothetical protein M1830_009281, partial [Pleopsidium flavum]